MLAWRLWLVFRPFRLLLPLALHNPATDHTVRYTAGKVDRLASQAGHGPLVKNTTIWSRCLVGVSTVAYNFPLDTCSFIVGISDRPFPVYWWLSLPTLGPALRRFGAFFTLFMRQVCRFGRMWSLMGLLSLTSLTTVCAVSFGGVFWVAANPPVGPLYYLVRSLCECAYHSASRTVLRLPGGGCFRVAYPCSICCCAGGRVVSVCTLWLHGISH